MLIIDAPVPVTLHNPSHRSLKNWVLTFFPVVVNEDDLLLAPVFGMLTDVIQ